MAYKPIQGRVHFTVSFPVDDYNALRAYCLDNKIPMGELIRSVLRQHKPLDAYREQQTQQTK